MKKHWDRTDIPKQGDTAYFVHLHLDTAVSDGHHEFREAIEVYRVEGKPRPMFVIQVLDKRDRNRRWLLTCPVTSKPLDSKDRERPDMLPIGNCLDQEKSSFVRLELHKLPENLLHAREGKSPVLAPCDPTAYRNVVRIVLHKALGKQLPQAG